MTKKLLCMLLAAILLLGVLPTPLFSFGEGENAGQPAGGQETGLNGTGTSDGINGHDGTSDENALPGEEPEPLYYVDADGEIVPLEGATEIVEGVTAWEGGFYVLTHDLTVEGPITVSGTVNLVLCAGATLTVNSEESDPGVYLPVGNTLNIFGQKADTGCLVANAGDMAAGIGGGDPYVGCVEDCGTLRVYGGTVRANGGFAASGIGGGDGGRGGIVEIYGGYVYANGCDYYASGIGGTSDYSGAPDFSGSLAVHGGLIRAAGDSAVRCDVTLDDGLIVYNMDRGVEDHAYALEEGACADALFGDLSYDLGGGNIDYLPANFRFYNGETTLSNAVWLVTSDYVLSRPISAPQGATMVVANGCTVDLRAGRGSGLTVGYRSTGNCKGVVLGDYCYDSEGYYHRIGTFTRYTGETELSGGWYYVTESYDIPILNADGSVTFVLADGVVFNATVLFRTPGYTARVFTESLNPNKGVGQVVGVDFVGLVAMLSYIDQNGTAQPLPADTAPYTGANELTAGWYLIFRDTDTRYVRANGDVHLVVCDNVTLNVAGGMVALPGDTLTLTSTGTGESMGSYNVPYTEDIQYARGHIEGIGGDQMQIGTVNIWSGNIDTALLGARYAKLNSGYDGRGHVNVYGGRIEADEAFTGGGWLTVYGGFLHADYSYSSGEFIFNGGEATVDEATGGDYVVNGATVSFDVFSGNLRMNGGTINCRIFNGENYMERNAVIVRGTVNADTFNIVNTVEVDSGTVVARRMTAMVSGFDRKLILKNSNVTVTNDQGPAIEAVADYGTLGYPDVEIDGGTAVFTGTETTVLKSLKVDGRGKVSFRMPEGSTKNALTVASGLAANVTNTLVDPKTKEFMTAEQAQTLPALDIIFMAFTVDGRTKTNFTVGKIYEGETVLKENWYYYVDGDYDLECLAYANGATLLIADGKTLSTDYLFASTSETTKVCQEADGQGTGTLSVGHTCQPYLPDAEAEETVQLPADTVIYNGQTALAANKWYYVPQDTTLSGRLCFGSGAHLVIEDRVTLTADTVVLNSLGTAAIHIHDPAHPGKLVGTYIYPGVGENDLPIGLPEDTLIYNGETVLEAGRTYYAMSDFDVGDRIIFREGATLVLEDGVTVGADYIFLPANRYSVYGISSGTDAGVLLGTKVYPYINASGKKTALPEDAIIYSGETALEAGRAYYVLGSFDVGTRLVFGEGALLVLSDGASVEADTVCLPTAGRAAFPTVSSGSGKGVLSGLLLLPYLDGGVTRAVPSDTVVYSGQTTLSSDTVYYVAQSADAGERLIVGEGTKIVLADGVTLGVDYIFLPDSGELNFYQVKEGSGRGVLSGMRVMPYYGADGNRHAVPVDAVIYAGEAALQANVWYFVPQSFDAGARLDIPSGAKLVLADGVVLTVDHIFTGTAEEPEVYAVSTGADRGVLDGELVRPYYDENGKTHPVPIDTVLYDGSAALTEGGYYIESNVTVNEPLIISGNVRLVLADGKRLSVVGGIAVTSGSVLTICAQSEESNAGNIYAIGGIGSAGIGSRMSENGGSVRIQSGSVTAIGGTGAAGIGAGAGGSAGVYISPRLFVQAGSDVRHLVGVSDPGDAPYVTVSPTGGGFDAYDVNADGKVDISDVTVLLNCLAGTSPEGVRPFDYDGDHAITIGDVTMLLNHLSGV